LNAQRNPLSDVLPRAPLRTPSDRLDRGETLTPGEQELDRKYQLLTATVDDIIKYEGHFSNALARGDVITNLRDAAIAGSVSHLTSPDDRLTEHAKKVTRHLIYEAKRKISHPKKLRDEFGRKLGWEAPEKSIPAGMFGQRLSGPKGKNLAEEAFLCDSIEQEWRLLSILELVGPENYKRLLNLAERRGDGTTNADRQWFHRMKKKIRNRNKIRSGFPCK
jgi:hypothetical protein